MQCLEGEGGFSGSSPNITTSKNKREDTFLVAILLIMTSLQALLQYKGAKHLIHGTTVVLRMEKVTVMGQDSQKPFIYVFSHSGSHGASKAVTGTLIFHLSCFQVFPSLSAST